ncbi:arylalkylamine N-acetyltransferase-like 2 [Adelges cooleyi]|uniref:arylalkylamine N-acetyltransferase-like 2 n=1 Tax=Adelges cooleyi TaxID=133065 RepID=UPI00217FD6CD|nr:arylalkylamine N-acetyltransferase-like 2 [Adelges cooleyi]
MLKNDSKIFLKPINIEIMPAKNEHIKGIKILMKEFYQDEPVFNAQKIDVETLDESFFDYDKFIKNDMTFVAIDTSNNTVASLATNEIIKSDYSVVHREEADLKYKSNTNLYRTLRLGVSIETEPCLFKIFNVNKILEIRTLATLQKYRGYGISKALAKCAFLAALNNDSISIIRIDCTNYFSSLIARELGMECVVKKHLSEYKDEKGQPWINIPKKPNDLLQIFVFRK